jgi:hypothetical protein
MPVAAGRRKLGAGEHSHRQPGSRRPSTQLVVGQIRDAGGEAVAGADNLPDFQGAGDWSRPRSTLSAGGYSSQQLGLTNFIPVPELGKRYRDRMDTHPSIRA